MNDPEIMTLLQKLESMYGKLAGEQSEIYIERLRGLSDRDFSEAVDILLESHPFKRFPLLAEIHRAVELARQKRPHIMPQEIAWCERCLNVGLFLAEDNTAGTARYCNCRFGYRAWQAHKIQLGSGPLIVRERPTRDRKNLAYPGDNYGG